MGKLLNITSEEQVLLYKLQHLAKPISYHDALHISGVLRLLVNDKLIHRVNMNYRLKIEFEYCDGNCNPIMLYSPLIYKQLKSDTESNLHPTVNKITLGKFTTLGIINTQLGIVTIEDIILYASNQKGGIHFQDNKQTNRNILTEQKLSSITDWNTESFIIISISTIVELLCHGLSNLIDTILDMRHDDIIQHYLPARVDSFKNGLRHFKAEGGLFLEYKQIHYYNSIGYFFLFAIYPQLATVTLFESRVENESSSIKIQLDNNYFFIFNLRLKNKAYCFKTSWSINYSQLFGRVIAFSFAFLHSKSDLYFVAKIENIILIQQKIEQSADFEIDYLSIAQDNRNQQNADLSLGELIVAQNVNFERFNELHEYLHLAKARLPFTKYDSY